MADYQKNNYKTIVVRVLLKETELLSFLDEKKPLNSYILNLLKEEFKKEKHR